NVCSAFGQQSDQFDTVIGSPTKLFQLVNKWHNTCLESVSVGSAMYLIVRPSARPGRWSFRGLPRRRKGGGDFEGARFALNWTQAEVCPGESPRTRERKLRSRRATCGHGVRDLLVAMGRRRQMMAPLARDQHGNPFELPPEAAFWRVRRHTGGR